MNTLLWVLQAVTALLFVASGIMKAFMFDKVSQDVRPLVHCPEKSGWRSASWSWFARSG